MRWIVIGANLAFATVADQDAQLEKMIGKAFMPAVATSPHRVGNMHLHPGAPLANFPAREADQPVVKLRGEIFKLKEKNHRIKARLEGVRSRIANLEWARTQTKPIGVQNSRTMISDFGFLSYGIGATALLSIIYRFVVKGNGFSQGTSSNPLDASDLQSAAATTLPATFSNCKLRTAGSVMSEGDGFEGSGALRALVTSFLCLSLAGAPCSSLAVEATATAGAGSPIAREVVQLVDQYFLDRTFNGVNVKAELARLRDQELSETEAFDEASNIVRSLGDRYSRLLTPAEVERLSKYDVTGVGINLVIDAKTIDGRAQVGAMTIGAVPPADSDAARQGVAFGDVVTAIKGKSTEGMTSFDALEVIQADGDEPVVLTLRPAAGGATRDVSLRKAFTERKAVSYHLVEVDGGVRVGYIKLSEFSAQCKNKVREAVGALEAQGASRLILDVRGNSGGIVEGALGIAGLFMERPLVLYATDANGSMLPLYSREGRVSDSPLQVWVDARSASASEVLAAGLRDNCRARLVGGTTYGKGVIQGVFGLSNGGALVETVSSYSTPAKQEINLKGVKPDEPSIFISDVLGERFVDADVKAHSKSTEFGTAGGVCAEGRPAQSM